MQTRSFFWGVGGGFGISGEFLGLHKRSDDDLRRLSLKTCVVYGKSDKIGKRIFRCYFHTWHSFVLGSAQRQFYSPFVLGCPDQK